MTHSFFAALVGAIAIVFGGTPSFAQNAYITNAGSNTVSVIDTATDTVVATTTAGITPGGVAVASDGSKVYVTNQTSQTVSVIATATNLTVATIPVGVRPAGVAVTPDGSKVYVTNVGDGITGTVSVIRTLTNTVA